MPKIRFSSKDQLSTRLAKVGEKQITFEKVIPLKLPPIPEPQTPVAKTPAKMRASEKLELMRLKEKVSRFAFIGASVFRLKGSPDHVRTFVRFRLSQDSEFFGAWSTADWEYLSGFSAFKGSDGEEYCSILTISIIEVEDFSQVSKVLGEIHSSFEFPKSLNNGMASFVVTEGHANPASLAALTALHDIYNQDLPRLKAALLGRKVAAFKHAEALKADPPDKKDVVFRYWRMDKAGRNGVEAKPANIR